MIRALLAVLLPAILAGCGGPQNFMEPAGTAARGLAALGWLALLAFSAVTLIVWTMIVWLALRRRGSLAEHASAETGGGQSWILIGGVAIPVAILAIVFISSLQAIEAYPLAPHHDAEPDIRIVGQQWWFAAEYAVPGRTGAIAVPTEIHVPAGRTIDIELVSRDVIHSFWVPKLHGKVDLVPGQPNRIRIEADAPGIYHGQCAEFCGMQHAHMRIAVVAHTEDDYARWLQAQLAPAREANTADAQQGQQVFMRSACPLCHAIRGTDARGNVGPDLTHLASRDTIAGGILENDAANLSVWITRAQTLKPGTRMPDVGGFTGEELRSLVAYLQSLR